ncbi:ATP-binding protein [Pseudobowmanella zhangzhouensis]
MPWHFTVTIEGEDIRLINPITHLIEQLSAQRGLHRHSGYLFTILSELYANALEHGLLQLDSSMKDDDEGFSAYYRLREQRLAALNSGKIRIEMSFNPRQQQIVICVEDSGQGFGYKEMQTGPQGLDALHGRGLNLLRCLSGNVEYADGGTRVTVVYHLDN